MDVKFYKCQICGQIVMTVVNKNNPVICCQHEMKELIPNSTDLNKGDYHLPVIITKKDQVEVKVGLLPHPNNDIHYIKWIGLITNKGGYIKYLKPTDKPKATFNLEEGEKVKDVYSLCNIHQLWKLSTDGSVYKKV